MAPIVALDLCDRRDVTGAKSFGLAGEDEEDDGKDQQHTAAGHPEPRHDLRMLGSVASKRTRGGFWRDDWAQKGSLGRRMRVKLKGEQLKGDWEVSAEHERKMGSNG